MSTVSLANLPRSSCILLSREYIEGTFAFDLTPAGASIVSFVPVRHFQPNVQYQVLLLGLDASLTLDVIKNLAGEGMALSYNWSFQAGDLNLTVPPVQSLLIVNTPASAINPADIKSFPASWSAPTSPRSLTSSSRAQSTRLPSISPN